MFLHTRYHKKKNFHSFTITTILIYTFRNCVIDKTFTVKVSDHAMYCDRYEPDYYISDTQCRLPIRWMSWENLLLVCILITFSFDPNVFSHLLVTPAITLNPTHFNLKVISKS